MIQNLTDYILTILAIFILGFIYQQKENITLGFEYYIFLPIFIYAIYYYGEKSLEKILIYLTSKKRWKI